MNNEKRNKHMTLDDRIEIQECLNKGMTFKAIAQRTRKDQRRDFEREQLDPRKARRINKSRRESPGILKKPTFIAMRRLAFF